MKNELDVVGGLHAVRVYWQGMGARAEPMPCGQHIGCLVRGCKNSNKYVLKQIFLLRPEWFQKIFFIFAVEIKHFLHAVGHQSVGLAG